MVNIKANKVMGILINTGIKASDLEKVNNRYALIKEETVDGVKEIEELFVVTRGSVGQISEHSMVCNIVSDADNTLCCNVEVPNSFANDTSEDADAKFRKYVVSVIPNGLIEKIKETNDSLITRLAEIKNAEDAKAAAIEFITFA